MDEVIKLREWIIAEIRATVYESDDVADHMHQKAAEKAADATLDRIKDQSHPD